MTYLTAREGVARGRTKRQFDAWRWPLSRVINWIAFGDAECFEKSVGATWRYSGALMRSADPYGALFRAFQAGLIRPIEGGAEWETWIDPPSPKNWPRWCFRRDDVISIWPGRFRLVDGDTRQRFGLVELAQSWAEATGEAWPIILYRICDWAVTDAFPDDAFVTSEDQSVTFHKDMIFRRGTWHADIQRKLLREHDHRAKARMQNFADRHLDVLRGALVGRDVVLEVCQAMDVAPPPICGSIAAAPAKHAVPPEPPPDTVVGVFARDNKRYREWRRGTIGKVMPSDEAEKYIMLWDAAAAMSREKNEVIERNWLRLMDAFWCGHLSPSGLVCFYRTTIGGREFVLQEREPLAGLLLGWRAVGDGTREPAQLIENLRHWTVADYLQQPNPFGDYFRRDLEGRFGLAVLTREFERWCRSTVHNDDLAPPARPNVAQQADLIDRRQRRGRYVGTLAVFMLRFSDERLMRLPDAVIAREFERYCEEQRKAGKPAPTLPKDRRNIENQVAKIRAQKRPSGTEGADPSNA